MLVDLLFPIRCIICLEDGKWLCLNCQSEVKFHEAQACPFCPAVTGGRTCLKCSERKYLAGLISIGSYKDPILRSAIHKFKFSGVTELKHELEKIMKRFLSGRESLLLHEGETFFVPVPLHGAKLRERGFNQAETLAKILGRHFEIPVREVLSRREWTHPQSEIDDDDKREHNVREAFECIEPTLVKDKQVILVDDVFTTGATMEACAKALLAAGAQQVSGFALAR